MIKLCISGSKGKMGSRIVALAKEDAEFEISGEFDAGIEAGPLVKECDCLIEFTSPQATMEHLALCEENKRAMVIGTTGLSAAEQEKIKEVSAKMPVVFSPNMSIGVNLLFKMIRDSSKILGPEYEVSIVEAHHVHKKDAPSGTAKELTRIIKENRGDVKVPIDSVREAEIVGEHTITFESEYDLIEITHSAKTRDIFARGALSAAKFVVGKKSGLFSMKDVLGL
ncbi:MAG: 4-hydroxy-tetrahydrodipicolinate reductase [Candidatus Omnitrophota bacterium]